MNHRPFAVADIISHPQMCSAEGRMLQHGMNFGNSTYGSVFLMSRRPGAPYKDQVLDDGLTLIYEGHDIPRRRGETRDPKKVDQPRRTPGGQLTPNGKFEQAALEFKAGKRDPELISVYEKVKDGIWVFNGIFALIDVWQEQSGRRQVFKFRLELSDRDTQAPLLGNNQDLEHTRMIPSFVKQEVFKRDHGRCVLCGSSENLHFDHELPFSKGGTSLTAANIRLLCARHNLAKGARIE